MCLFWRSRAHFATISRKQKINCLWPKVRPVKSYQGKETTSSFHVDLIIFLCLPAALVAVLEKLNTPPGCCEVALLGAGVD